MSSGGEIDFKTFLQTHSLFQRLTPKININNNNNNNNNNFNGISNIIVNNVSMDELLVFDANTLKLYVVALHSWSKERLQKIQVISIVKNLSYHNKSKSTK